MWVPAATKNDEVWKPVIGSPNFEVSSLGRLRWRASGELKLPTCRGGELVVNLYAAGKGMVRNLRSIVAEAHLRPRHPGEMVIHLDGDRSNCAAENLEYASLSLRGPIDPNERARSVSRKLTMRQAEEIRRRARAGEAVVALAGEFGVSAPLVSNIKRGLKWRKLAES
jgi:hypothetical protein